MIAPLALKALAEKPLLPIAEDRRVALTGWWEGKLVEQQPNQGEVDVEGCSFELEASKKPVVGRGELRARVDERDVFLELSVTGGFRYDTFLKIDYVNKDIRFIQFGSAILELSPDGKRLEGRFCGFGALTGQVVSGSLKLFKFSS